jgi:outer membrane biosynthesis protein TonB
MFNPESFQFDEDELKSETKKQDELGSSSDIGEDVTEDMESISLEDVPKPRRSRKANKKEKPTPKPKPKPKPRPKRKAKNPKKASSKRVLSEEFEIEEEDNFNKENPEELDDPNDAKFNSAKYHKRQHKL